MVSVDSNFVARQWERIIDRSSEKTNTDLGPILQAPYEFIKDQSLLHRSFYVLAFENIVSFIQKLILSDFSAD